MARPTNLPSKQDEVVSFCRTFLPIYLLVMSSEWLSGPYLYTLLRDDRDLPEAMVCALYATAYTSAAASAPIVGFLADRFGRRAACLVQCVVHVAACLTVVLGGTSLPVLFIGRVLAGVGLTLLWTVFESWMVTEWNARGFSDKDENAAEGATTTSGLSTMFGIMTIANCMTAIVGGMLGHCMVSVMGSKVWPFWTGIVLEGVAAVLMLRYMNENYGVKHDKVEHGTSPAPETTWFSRLGDGRIWALTFATCCFEGTSFLVVFFWPSVLQAAHGPEGDTVHTSTGDTTIHSSSSSVVSRAHSNTNNLPHGVIFGTFMAAMILGALLFRALSRTKALQFPGSAATKVPVSLLVSAIVLAGVSLTWLSMLRSELAQFCAFLAFEVANGIYVPSMACARGLVVDDKSRAGLYGLMKLPLFVFVILALGIVAKDNHSRRSIFVLASFCLLLAVLALLLGFWQAINPPNQMSQDEKNASDLEDQSAKSGRGVYKQLPQVIAEKMEDLSYRNSMEEM